MRVGVWVVAVWMLGGWGFAADKETARERALRQQLEEVQVSLNKALTRVGELNASNAERAKTLAHSVTSASEQAIESAESAESSAQTRAEEARMTAKAAKSAAEQVAAINRSLIMAVLVGLLCMFLVMVAALAFILVDVRSKASADRKVYLDHLIGTKQVLTELVANTNHKMDLLLEAKDDLRESTNKAQFAKELTQKSLPEIGELFGGRDHTTVLHAVRKIAD